MADMRHTFDDDDLKQPYYNMFSLSGSGFFGSVVCIINFGGGFVDYSLEVWFAMPIALSEVHVKPCMETIYIKGGCFDLVVTNVHKPDMDGFVFPQVMTQVFELPVLSDNKEGTILKGLKGVSVDDLRDHGLYTALQEKKGKRAISGKSAMKQGKQGKR